jgi:hypothetical protein
MGTQSRRIQHTDPVEVDSKHYKVEFENEQVRVLRIKYGPYESSPMHGHPGMVAIFLTDQNSQFKYPDGRVQEMRGKAGEVKYMDAFEHEPTNMSDQPMEVIAVELKQPKG